MKWFQSTTKASLESERTTSTSERRTTWFDFVRVQDANRHPLKASHQKGWSLLSTLRLRRTTWSQKILQGIPSSRLKLSIDLLTTFRFEFRNCTQLILLWEFIADIWSQLLYFVTFCPNLKTFPNRVSFEKQFWARSLVYAACLSIPLYWAYRAISKKYRTIFVAQELAKL